MNDLRRELAPVTDEAWEQIEQEAKRTLKTYLAARKLVDFQGPLGWEHSAANRGRSERLTDSPADDVEARLRLVQPLVELRRPFELPRDEIDDISRGKPDPDLTPVIEAARRLAYAEDRIVFDGYAPAGIRGIFTSSGNEPIEVATDHFTDYPRIIAEAIERIREDGIAGPYAIALSPPWYNGLTRTVEGGYPVLRHVERILDGPIIWAPALTGALVLSLRGGDFELIVGRDASIGYLDHDRTSVRLYLEESLTFQLITPEASVPLQAG